MPILPPEMKKPHDIESNLRDRMFTTRRPPKITGTPSSHQIEDFSSEERQVENNCEDKKIYTQYSNECKNALHEYVTNFNQLIFRVQPNCQRIREINFLVLATPKDSFNCYQFIKDHQTTLYDARFSSLSICETLKPCNERNPIHWESPTKSPSILFYHHNETHAALNKHTPLSTNNDISHMLILLICLSMSAGVTMICLKMMRSLQKQPTTNNEESSPEKQKLTRGRPKADYGATSMRV